MSTLVEVHEIHVDVVPWNFGIVLGVQVQQRLVQNLQTVNPHLGWRESVHPCDDTHTMSIVVGF